MSKGRCSEIKDVVLGMLGAAFCIANIVGAWATLPWWLAAVWAYPFVGVSVLAVIDGFLGGVTYRLIHESKYPTDVVVLYAIWPWVASIVVFYAMRYGPPMTTDSPKGAP